MTDTLIATSSTVLESVLVDVQSCTLCEAELPYGPRPIVHMASTAKLLIIGQAPGRRVHETGVPWNDPSGDRLRRWLNTSREQFYNQANIAIMPMGFCYPGTGKSGDLPPRKECAPLWHSQLLKHLPHIQLTLFIGQYAQQYYFDDKKLSLTARVQQWPQYLPHRLPLPHPSPRNQRWLKKNPWFDEQVVPRLQHIVADLLDD